MNADKKNRSTGTTCITDCRFDVTERPAKAMPKRSGPYVMSQPGKKSNMLKSAANPPIPAASSLPEAAGALDTLRASQKLIQLGRLAASIAHEVNNPLESVSNLLYLIRGEPGLPQGAVAYLDMADREMRRVISISKQTLNFARAASEPMDLSLPDLLEEVLILYRRRIDEKRLRIVQKYAPTEAIHAIPGEMRQVLANLIVNAIEACDERGCLTLRVRPAVAAQRARGIRVTIADNGAGIPPHVRRRLGEPFFSTKGQEGTGLGLWVSRSIIERHGGSLRLRSIHHQEPRGEALHGSVFTLFLPIEPAARPQSTGAGGGGGPALVPRRSNTGREAGGSSIRLTTNDI